MTAQQAPQKPKALRAGSRIAPIAPASPGQEERTKLGIEELLRLGFHCSPRMASNPQGYFAAPADERRREFLLALNDRSIDALVSVRGGYGSAYLLEELPALLPPIKPIVGFSDLTTLQIYLWQKHRWPTFYGPMLAAGFDAGADVASGYDSRSFRHALMKPDPGWQVPLCGETLFPGVGEGMLVGGAMTLVEATLGTSWELDTTGAIFLLEDRAMKPYQVDRVLLHLKQARKFENVRGIVLGDFPECQAPLPASPSVREVALRILEPLDVPVVFGAPFGHTTRPMLTLPLGVRSRLVAQGSGTLEFLEPTVLS
jgi:muramoyltetrapeptide carboxypeptidase